MTARYAIPGVYRQPDGHGRHRWHWWIALAGRQATVLFVHGDTRTWAGAKLAVWRRLRREAR